MILSYLGSKASIMPQLDKVIAPLLTRDTRFCDLFLGSGYVANFYKDKVRVVSGCDTELYSYVLSSALLKSPYSFKIGRVIDVLNELVNGEGGGGGLVCNNFSKRFLFFSVQNAARIDFMRKSISLLYDRGIVNYKEFVFLLASLLKAASKYANTTGTFRAHLKHLSKKALRPLILTPIHKDLRVAQRAVIKRQDVDTFVSIMEPVDIVYIDPPYNCVHYSAYYSFLNYLCLYDSDAELVGTGILKDYYKSKLGIVKTAYAEIKKLLDVVSTKTRHIIFSYNSNGAIPITALIHLMKRYGKIKINRFPYKKYQSNKTASLKQNSVSEYIISCQVF